MFLDIPKWYTINVVNKWFGAFPQGFPPTAAWHALISLCVARMFINVARTTMSSGSQWRGDMDTSADGSYTGASLNVALAGLGAPA